LTPADLTRQIFQAITTTTISAVTTSATGLGGDLQNQGKGALDKIKSLFK
jgi:hypothetical protein